MTTAGEAAVNVGQVVVVPYVNESGLRRESTLQFMVRGAHAALWNALHASSCLVDGPPGSGKSTAVWLWLIERVQRTGNAALWVHFTKLGYMLAVVIERTEEGRLVFNKVLRKDPFDDHEVQKAVRVCVVDGVTAANKDKAGESWYVFGMDPSVYANCHMIWVSSQQLVIPGEHLAVVKMERHLCFSWGKDEIIAYAATFDAETRSKYVKDIVSGLPSRRLTPGESIDFDQAIAIKLHYCGCSARWMFGMSMEEAIADIELHLSKVQDAKLIQAGLSGARGLTAVNHIIATYASDDPERLGLFSIASNFIMERVSETVGLEAIRVMYSSHWVNNNPAVHGFVFEWDILTRLEKFKSLTLTDVHGSNTTWSITKSVRLSEVLYHGITADKTLVCPEKWNHPEFDGLYIHKDHGGLHLVAWNASEASTHSGSVSKLVVLLESLSQREVESINFVNVRFLFLVPVETLASFKMPRDSQRLLARQQLAAWSFADFEVYGTTRTLT